MEDRKMVAYVIEKMKIASGCVCSHIASGLGRLDEIGKECDEMACLDCKKKWLGILGDMVDEELIEATRSGIDASLGDALSSLADANGWPEMKESESATAYIERCFLPRPLFDDGEPVQFGDCTRRLNGVEKYIFMRSGGVSCQMQDADGNMQAVFHGERVRRPAPEVLDMDGVPIKVGETVYNLVGGKHTVEHIEPIDTGLVRVWYEGGGYDFSDRVTHTPSDTQESIEMDALLPTNHYWRCEDAPCDECPARVDGKNPSERYGTPEDCDLAMMLDLLRRQRELDALTGGKE